MLINFLPNIVFVLNLIFLNFLRFLTLWSSLYMKFSFSEDISDFLISQKVTFMLKTLLTPWFLFVIVLRIFVRVWKIAKGMKRDSTLRGTLRSRSISRLAKIPTLYCNCLRLVLKQNSKVFMTHTISFLLGEEKKRMHVQRTLGNSV